MAHAITFKKTLLISVVVSVAIFLVLFRINHNNAEHLDVDKVATAVGGNLINDPDYLKKFVAALNGSGLIQSGDLDKDGIPDSVDPDIDGDNVPNDQDTDANNNRIPDAKDSDHDGITDEYDQDDDNDGSPDTQDDDNDNDGIPDAGDEDSNDSVIPGPQGPAGPAGDLAILTNVGLDTETSGNILVANGTSWNSTPVSGDIELISSGAMTILPNKVKTANIVDSAVSEAKLLNDAVTTGKVKDGAVTGAKILNFAVTQDKVADAAVTTAKLRDGSVNGVKIALGSDALGDIMYYDGTKWALLQIGSTDQVLKVGSSGVPTWGTPESTPLIAFLTGSVMFRPGTTVDDSFGIPLNGQTVTNGVTLYPILAAKILSGDLAGVATIVGPNLVMANWNQIGAAQGGYFLRGLGNRTPGQLNNGSTARPNTPFGTNTDTHDHSGTTDSAGVHHHTFDYTNGLTGNGGDSYESGTDGSDGTLSTEDAGAHTHTFTTDSDAHNHTVTTGGDAETAPKAASGLWYVFAEKS
ncbi:MAG TPA: hypothetical protein VMY99_01810 [Nevskiaceae bacterium]|nr:hypothetical protein [Nevskiaceae bacterium]